VRSAASECGHGSCWPWRSCRRLEATAAGRRRILRCRGGGRLHDARRGGGPSLAAARRTRPGHPLGAAYRPTAPEASASCEDGRKRVCVWAPASSGGGAGEDVLPTGRAHPLSTQTCWKTKSGREKHVLSPGRACGPVAGCGKNFRPKKKREVCRSRSERARVVEGWAWQWGGREWSNPHQRLMSRPSTLRHSCDATWSATTRESEVGSHREESVREGPL
jgi:hypothetical protein